MRSLAGSWQPFSTKPILLVITLALSLSPALAHGQSRLDITKDKDKTVYTVRSGSRGSEDEALEKERTWEMLKNVRIHNDGKKPAGDRERSSRDSIPSPPPGAKE